MSNWEKFKSQKGQSPSDEEPVGMMIAGTYICQFCGNFVLEGKYFPTDSVLTYKCDEGHVSFVENFRMM